MSATDPVTIETLTQGTKEGSGTFDHIMRAVAVHVQGEFDANRIRGPEYSQVFLSSLNTAMDQAIRFILEKNNAELLCKQIELADKQIEKTAADILLVEAQIAKMEFERDLTEQQVLNLKAELLRTNAQTDQILAENLNIPKQGELLDQQVLSQKAQILNIEAETLNVPKQGAVLDAQECKLRADYDLVLEQIKRTVEETAVMAQKKITEQAQTNGTVADANSVVGRQKALLVAQTEGFDRDAEQKAAGVAADLLSVEAGISVGASVGEAMNYEAMISIFDKLRQGIDIDTAAVPSTNTD